MKLYGLDDGQVKIFVSRLNIEYDSSIVSKLSETITDNEIKLLMRKFE